MTLPNRGRAVEWLHPSSFDKLRMRRLRMRRVLIDNKKILILSLTKDVLASGGVVRGAGISQP